MSSSSVTWISFPGGGLAEGSGTLVLYTLSMPSLCTLHSLYIYTPPQAPDSTWLVMFVSSVPPPSPQKKNHSSRLCFTPPFLSPAGEGCNFY